MKELFYYAIFAIILYFLLSAVFDNFYLEQENFDPSLVPVSSIVTLAKVAQKLVNGNGTLTNPGNLQIGASASTPGNLTVTGGISVNGTNGKTTIPKGEVNNDTLFIDNSIVAGNISIGPFTQGTGYDVIRSNAPNGLLLSSAAKSIYIWGNNNLNVQGDTTFERFVNAKGNMTLGGSLNLENSNPKIVFKKSGQPHQPQLYSDERGIIHVTGGHFKSDNDLEVGATLQVNGNAKINEKLVVTGNITAIDITARNITASDDVRANRHVYVDQNLQVNGNAQINGKLVVPSNITTRQLCIGTTCINEAQLKILTGEASVNLQTRAVGKVLHNHYDNGIFLDRQNNNDGSSQYQSFFLSNPWT